jgi:hypothetical protein
VINRLGVPRKYPRSRLKKLVGKNREKRGEIRIASWNVATMTGKSMEVVEVLKRRKVEIACVQEIKWKGEKTKELG